METESRDQLTAWVRTVSDAAISFAQPHSAPADATTVSLYLLEMHGDMRLRPARPDVRQLELSYLVTANAADGDVEELLVDLCFSAMDEPGIEVDLDPPALELWQALGVPPQPSFRVSIPLRRRHEVDVQPVLHPLVIQPAALSSIAGIVATPEQMPIPDARVEAQQLGRLAVTDRRGRFRLDGIPVDGRALHLVVSARGRQVIHDVGADDDRSHVVLTIDPAEAVNG